MSLWCPRRQNRMSHVHIIYRAESVGPVGHSVRREPGSSFPSTSLAGRRLTFSARGLVESACPGPSLLANLCPRLLGRPLDGGLVALLDSHNQAC